MAGFYSAATQRPYAAAPWPTIPPPRTPPANLQARLTGVAQRYQLSAKDMARLVSAVGSIVAGKRDAIAQHLSTG
ncbi:MAG: hypothetical protein ACJ8FD_11550, partial [Bradyrhizobium canariense]